MEYYEIHKSASLVPLASEAEQIALMEDIKANGQQQPIALYRGKIVDGRCRQNACIELGISVDAKELPNNMSIQEVEKFVKSINTRRNLTRVQKVAASFKQMEKNNVKNDSLAAKQWGITRQEISNFRFISNHRPEYVDILFNGGAIEYVDPASGKIKKGTSLYPIRKSIEAIINETEENQTITTGNVDMAKGFAQIRAAVSFLPSNLTSKEKVFILKIVSKEEEGK
jgi:hypothetical protein